MLRIESAMIMMMLWCVLADNTTIVDDSQGFEMVSSLDELELELEQQPPAERRGSYGTRLSLGWSPWSEWSTCSRTCDGGASYQLRTCNAPTGCRGDAVRYKICSMQPCPESGEFRSQQCAAYNDVPYEDTLFKWKSHSDEREPCALTCKGHPVDDPESHIIVQLSPKVQDGTRCRSGSLDMCINGKCQRVGCDLKIGSEKRVDECGVCGGDGSSCAQPLYHWEDAPMSLCSVTCGGGYKMSRPVCRNRVSGEEAEELLCNAAQRPEPKLVDCNTHRCPAKWVLDDWGPCSVTCGGGVRFKHVHCAEEGNGTKVKVPEHLCHGHKPRYQESCNEMDCPEWNTGPWSGCSVSCGEGMQSREVRCRDARGNPSVLCDPFAKPGVTRLCRTGIPCPTHRISFFDSGGGDEDEEIEHLPGQGHTQPLVQPYPPISASGSDERLDGQQVVPSESTFIAQGWGPCSVTCGDGVRTREVKCKIFLEFSKTIATLPDHQCQGPRPVDTERCFETPCPMSNSFSDFRMDNLGLRDGYSEPLPSDTYMTHYGDSNIKVASGTSAKATYAWKTQGYTHCSASCLGGVQEQLINCVRESDQKPVSPFLCPEPKPEILYITCNDHPCPPRWNFSNYQPCTKSCGIGIQTREVTCIHEVTRGESNTIIVPNSLCPQPPPPDRRNCNVLDCPVQWHTSGWSKCSRSCGGGIKTRQVECKQVMAQSHVVMKPESKCTSPKPPDKKPCNTKPCASDDYPRIAVSNTSYVQQNPSKKKVTLKIGGQAIIFLGTQVKIKCPVKKFDRSKIQWAKDHNYLTSSKKFKISRKGALRIQDVTYRDSGLYTCQAGKSTADLMLNVKPRPGEFLNSEELEKPHDANRAPTREGFTNSPVMDNEGPSHDAQSPFHDDQSHEKQEKVNIFKPLARNNDENNNININKARLPERGPTQRPTVNPMEDLWSFQAFGNSRGHRMVSDIMDEKSEGHFLGGHIDDDDSDEDGMGTAVILGKGSPENLKFEWMIAEWSKCSQTCGGGGFQMRGATCMVRLHNTSQNVDSNLCEDAGLQTPVTVQKCGFDDCPKWVSTNWSSCEESRCFTWNTAMQRRDVSCQLTNGTEVDLSFCNEDDKPPIRQECYNDKCRGTWKVGDWSECVAPCEKQGMKYRVLQCVWYGTKKPAGNACRDLPRPIVMKVCKGLPCLKMSECKDRSKYCPNVKAMNMCRVHRYQYQCCHSCRSKG